MPKRKEPNTDNENFEIVVVKRALHSVCKNERVFGQIQKDVQEMSSLFVEVSRYIHFSLKKQWKSGNFEPVRFLSFYYHLMKKKKAKYALDQEYEKLRKTLPLYDSSYRSNLFRASANQYEVIFHNNIWMHAYNRLRKFFKFEPDKKKVYRTLSYLFQAKSEEIPDTGLLQVLKEKLSWNGQKLDQIKNRKLFWSCLPLFYNLQRYNEKNNLKNFALIPILKHGCHHIQYDSFAFYQLLCGIKLYKGAWPTFQRDQEWRKHFKLSETVTKKFNYSLQTDGVAVSFSMKKPAMNVKTIKVKKKKLHAQDQDYSGDLLKMRNTTYENKLGLDPGLRLVYGGVSNGVPIKLKSSVYHYASGYYSRRQKLKKYTKKFEEDSQLSPYAEAFEQYTEYQLLIFAEKQKLYAQRKVTRLKLQKFICVEKTSHVIAKQLVPNAKEKTLVCIGSTETASNSPIRGYIRSPNKKLTNALRNRKADILFVNEFRTTKLCAKCFCENKTSKSPHRYQYCPNCSTCWNRDVNAGINILYLGECVIQQIEKHSNFSRI